jgi:hypothetical protein
VIKPGYVVELTGPMGPILEGLVVVRPDGTRHHLVEGIAVYESESFEEAVTRTFPGCELVWSPAEAEQLRRRLP